MPTEAKEATLEVHITPELLQTIKSPSSLLNKILDNILKTTKVSFDEEVGAGVVLYPDQGFVNAKDFQIQCLFEYEKLSHS